MAPSGERTMPTPNKSKKARMLARQPENSPPPGASSQSLSARKLKEGSALLRQNGTTTMGIRERRALSDLDASPPAIGGGRGLGAPAPAALVFDEFGPRRRTPPRRSAEPRASARVVPEPTPAPAPVRTRPQLPPPSPSAELDQENVVPASGSSGRRAPYSGMYRFGSFDQRALSDIPFRRDEDAYEEIDSDEEFESDNLALQLEERIREPGNPMYEFEIYRDPSPERAA